MKSLNIQFSKSLNPSFKGSYQVFLNRGNVLYFPSKRKAEDFIRIFESNTNDCLRSLNHIMSDIYSKYLDFYFHLDNLICRKIKLLIDSYNDRLLFFFKDFELGNQSFKLNAFYLNGYMS